MGARQLDLIIERVRAGHPAGWSCQHTAGTKDGL